MLAAVVAAVVAGLAVTAAAAGPDAPLPDPSTWVRVEDPDYPGALARSETGAVVAEPPTDGTAWAPESVGVPDVILADPEAPLPVPGALGDPVVLTHADLWHARGFTGKGVRVAIFDVAWFGGDTSVEVLGDADVYTHDCFASPSCEAPFDPLRPHAANEGGVHGWACAEAVHRMAPDAELHLVRTDSFTLLEDAVAWAAREGIDVISMSMSFYSDSFYDGTGPHTPLMDTLAASGALMVKSAGNDGQLHWAGTYVDADGDGRMDADGDNAVEIYLDGSPGLTLSWDEYGGRCGHTDLDLVVVSPDGDIVGASHALQPPPEPQLCRPVDVLTPVVKTPGTYRVEIWQRHGQRVGLDVNLVAKSGAFAHPVTDGSVVDPGVHPLVAAIGAVRATNYWTGPAEPYSSRGPTRARTVKPDLMGPDGLVSSAFGAIGFYGTSASTPVVAGLVAVVMSEDPSLTSAEAFAKLQGWAHLPTPTQQTDLNALGPGMARLPDPDPDPRGCGQHRLIGGIALVPLLGLRRRRRQ